jgi:glutamate/tyrosine decarboxylase-like PLP-dependent enzyme
MNYSPDGSSFADNELTASSQRDPNHFVERPMNEDQVRFLHKLIDIGCEFVNGGYRAGKVLQYESNELLQSILAESLPQVGSSLESLLHALEDRILPYSIAQFDKRFLAFPDTGNSLAALAADIIAPFCNQNLIAVDRSGPSATFVEIQTILWLREIIGYSAPKLRDLHSLGQVGGMWTPGGNLSNYTAVLAALHRHFPAVRKEGLGSLRQRPVIVAARGIDHFCFSNAAIALGLGSDGILWTEANDHFQTDPRSLRETLDGHSSHLTPFMVVSVAGNCRTTDIDNLQEIHSICDEHGLWMHVDACHGGSLLFSKKLRDNFLSGIERADSISLDPHKGLFLTYPSSYILFKDPTALAALSRYPERTHEKGLFDLGLITPFLGSRGFQSLKLWMLIKHMGLAGLSEAVEARQIVNHTLSQMLKSTELFVPLNDNKFYREAFVFCPRPIAGFLRSNKLSDEQRNAARALINSYTNKFNTNLYRSGEVVFDSYQMNDLANEINLGTNNKFCVMSMSVGHASMPGHVIDRIRQRLRAAGEPFAAAMTRDFAQLDMHVSPPEQTGKNENHEGFEGPAGW